MTNHRAGTRKPEASRPREDQGHRNASFLTSSTTTLGKGSCPSLSCPSLIRKPKKTAIICFRFRKPLNN